MERSISTALRKRTEVEWGFKPDEKDIQEQYYDLVKIIAEGLLKNEKVAFIKLEKNYILPKNIVAFQTEPTNQRLDHNTAVKIAETLLLRHARQYQDPYYDVALISQSAIRFPLRPDLKPVGIQQK